MVRANLVQGDSGLHEVERNGVRGQRQARVIEVDHFAVRLVREDYPEVREQEAFILGLFLFEHSDGRVSVVRDDSMIDESLREHIAKQMDLPLESVRIPK